MQGIKNAKDGKMLIRKEQLLEDAVFSSDASYRNQKSKKRLTEVKEEDGKYVEYNSLSSEAKRRVRERIKHIGSEYAAIMNDADSIGDSVETGIELTAQSLSINNTFIINELTTYINANYSRYVDFYMNFELKAESIRAYAKNCALIQWLYYNVKHIKEQNSDKRYVKLLLRSFRMNVLTALYGMNLGLRIPLSETRFNKWFDEALRDMRDGKLPQEIVQPKRANNKNSSKVTEEQLKIAQYWHINGTNMSVRNVYKRWVAYGKERGWWTDDDGSYSPPSEGRLYQLLVATKNPNLREKTDNVEYRKKAIPTVSRKLPKKKNHVWVIDGTAQNENVEFKKTVRQHLYNIKVADVATMRMLGISSVIGVKEQFDSVKEAILMSIRETGYKPAIIHCDRGPSWKELERWCEANDIRLYPSMAGNARAKTIENIFAAFDNDITRFLTGYSGQNRTATSVNSRSSDKREMRGKRNAKSASIAARWASTEGIKLWNERIIETLEKKPCGKTPMQLWNEKPSYTPQLSYEQICILLGILHERKLTVEGLEIVHKGVAYNYFPPINTKEERELANRIFTEIPMKADTLNRLKIYIVEGGKPAPVYAHDGRKLGIWNVKTEVDFIVETPEEKKKLSDYMALQYRVEEKAKELNESILQYTEKHPDFERIREIGNTPLVGKRLAVEAWECEEEAKVEGRYCKPMLLSEEVQYKAESNGKVQQYRELVDPDTGEIHKLPID